MIHNTVLIVALIKTTTYRPDSIGFIKLAVAALIGFVVSQQFVVEIHGWVDLLTVAMLACSFFLLTAYFIKPFQAEERARLNRLFNRKIFVW